jgi:CDP-diacylglycerol---glycerol-3-phosphate 3-phosphatidyltransferase
MNLPNRLTLLRIFFVPLLVATLLADNPRASWLGMIPVSRDLFALAIFLAAAATDLLDGYLARRWGQVTTVGTLLDPIADKLLISAALISLVEIHRIPAWIGIVIIGREFAVEGLRSIAAASGFTIRASDLGKSKMVAQVGAISLVIAGNRWPALDQLALPAMWVVMLFAVVSAADYFRRFWRKVDDGIKLRRRRELLALERAEQRLARKKRRAARSGAIPEASGIKSAD